MNHRVLTRQRVTQSWPSLLVALMFLLLSIGWAFASPRGSSADEDFHAINIWCSGGGSELCEEAGDGIGVIVPRTLSRFECYVNWPAYFGAACLKDIPQDTEYTTRVAIDRLKYSPLFYSTMRLLAGNNIELSIQVMRIFNSVVAAALLLWALLATSLSIRRSVALSWGAAMIPVGVFFVASINPSSWVITSVGLYWAFLASLLTPEGIQGTRKWNLLAGLLAAATLGISARTDAGLYLVISTVAVLIWRWPFVKSHLSRSMKMVGAIFALLLMAISGFILWNRYGLLSLSFPGAQTSTGQPTPALKTLMEFPSFLVGLLGGQESKFIMADTDVSVGMEGYRPSGFTFGIGWTETDLPSLVSIGVGFVVAGLIVLAVARATKLRLLAAGLMIVAMAMQILLMLAVSDFKYVAPIQPRYFFPIALAALGILLASEIQGRLLTRVHIVVFTGILTVTGTVAFLATSARYAVGPHAAMTNFGHPLEWWWDYAPGRLASTGIMALITFGWVLATMGIFPAKIKPTQSDSPQLS